AIDVGNRTLAMAQRVVHQVVQVLAPDCAPLFLTDGFREYLTALLTHYGHWVQPPRRPGKGAEAALDATAAAPLCPGGQNRAPAALGPRAPSRGLRDTRGGAAGAGGVWLADQHRVH